MNFELPPWKENLLQAFLFLITGLALAIAGRIFYIEAFEHVPVD